MDHAAVVSLDYHNERRARTVRRSLGVEVGRIDDDRSRTTVDRAGATVTLEVAAADLVALRAALNTWLRMAGVAERAAAAGAGAT